MLRCHTHRRRPVVNYGNFNLAAYKTVAGHLMSLSVKRTVTSWVHALIKPYLHRSATLLTGRPITFGPTQRDEHLSAVLLQNGLIWTGIQPGTERFGLKRAWRA